MRLALYGFITGALDAGFVTLDFSGGVATATWYDAAGEATGRVANFWSQEDATAALARDYGTGFEGWWIVPAGMDGPTAARTHAEEWQYRDRARVD